MDGWLHPGEEEFLAVMGASVETSPVEIGDCSMRMSSRLHERCGLPNERFDWRIADREIRVDSFRQCVDELAMLVALFAGRQVESANNFMPRVWGRDFDWCDRLSIQLDCSNFASVY